MLIKKIKLFFPYVIFVFVTIFLAITWANIIYTQHYRVRVLLDEHKVNSKSWDICSDDHLVLIAPNKYKRQEKIYRNKKITVQLKKEKNSHHIYLNNHRYDKDRLYIVPCSGHLSYNNKQYQGSFLVAKEKDKLFLINCIDVEDYLYSVLKTESWPGWPLEVNKVFAIASRSYALSMIVGSYKSKRLYHIKNTNHHQTYSGMHDHDHLKEAVEQTRGMYLSYNSKPILAMFDSCCGGIIPAYIHKKICFEIAPYLARDYPCTYCKSCKIYNWIAEFTLNEFEKRLKEHIKDVPILHGFSIKKRDKAGIVHKVVVRGKPQDTILSGENIYAIFKEVKSFCFRVYKKGKKITLHGRGYGHHIGLCQWGAREMVRNGWHYKQILEFYYPGTTFMKLL